MSRKWAAKADGNQPALVKFIRKLGASFQHTHRIPGALDGIIGYEGLDQRVEIKDPSATSQALTEAEAKVFNEWKGRKPVVIMTEEDIESLLADMRKAGL